MKNIFFEGNIIEINNIKVRLDHPVIDAFIIDEKVVVLFDPDDYIPKYGQFKNLIALNYLGEILWVAELPTTGTGDCYIKIISKNPIKAISYRSQICEINESTGKIVSKEFTK